MKPIKKNEIFGHISGFLKTRGIELKEGSYAESIQKGCSLLTDTINLSQHGLEKAKVQLDKQVETMRQVIHARTAPSPAGLVLPERTLATASPPACPGSRRARQPPESARQDPD